VALAFTGRLLIKVQERAYAAIGRATNGAPRAGCGKLDTGFPHGSRSKHLESITFYDFGLIQSKIIVI
jgi:hypothetical protein